jgi:hypothetical protein
MGSLLRTSVIFFENMCPDPRRLRLRALQRFEGATVAR